MDRMTNRVQRLADPRHDESSGRRRQLVQMLAGVPYDQQMAALQPPMPIAFGSVPPGAVVQMKRGRRSRRASAEDSTGSETSAAPAEATPAMIPINAPIAASIVAAAASRGRPGVERALEARHIRSIGSPADDKEVITGLAEYDAFVGSLVALVFIEGLSQGLSGGQTTSTVLAAAIPAIERCFEPAAALTRAYRADRRRGGTHKDEASATAVTEFTVALFQELSELRPLAA